MIPLKYTLVICVIKGAVELSSLTGDQEQEAFQDAPSAESVDHPSRQIVPQGVNPAPEGAEQIA